MKVLLCDDDEDILHLLEEELKCLGCEVHCASSGYAALGALRADTFDAVVTDYRMPEGDGGMLSNYCNDRGIACVVVTGFECDHVRAYVPQTISVYGKIEFFDALRRFTQGVVDPV